MTENVILLQNHLKVFSLSTKAENRGKKFEVNIHGKLNNQNHL